MKAVVRAALVVPMLVSAALSARAEGLVIEYPAEGAVFPPDFAAPTLIWRDGSRANAWRIDVSFGSGAASLRLTSSGPRVRVGEIDRDCISTTNELPKADPRQRVWKPGAAMWELIKRQSKGGQELKRRRNSAGCLSRLN